MGPVRIWQALVDGGKASLFVAALTGAVGILIGVLALTGIGHRVPRTSLLEVAGKSLPADACSCLRAATLVLGLALPDHGHLSDGCRRRGAGDGSDLGVPLLTAHLIILVAEPGLQHHTAGSPGPLCSRRYRRGRPHEDRLGLLSLCQDHLCHACAHGLYPYPAYWNTSAKFLGREFGHGGRRRLLDPKHHFLSGSDDDF